MSSVFVLGGHGFLGQHILRQLGAAGHVVVPGPPQDELDVLVDPAPLVAILRELRPFAVVNAVGVVGGSAEALEAGNVGTVRAVLDSCVKAGIAPRFVHLGSLAEYGPAQGRPFLESDAPAPVSPYGKAKLAATEEVLATPDGVVLRVANPIGAGQPRATLAGAVLDQLRQAPDAPVRTGGLDAVRDFVSARDVGRAVAAAVATLAPPSLVNVGTGVPVSSADLVRAILDTAGHTAGLEIAAIGSERSATDDVAYPDVTLARTGLGWKAADDLRDAVADLFAAVR